MADHKVTVVKSEPRVVRRVVKVYKQPGAGGSGQPGSSMVTYDNNTDNDIFQLGSAFQSEGFDIDDFLNKMSEQSGTTVQKVGDDGKTTITQVSEVKPGDNVPMIDIDGDGIPDVPATRTRRIITITKSGDDSPKSETERLLRDSDDESQKTEDDVTSKGEPGEKQSHLVLPPVRPYPSPMPSPSFQRRTSPTPLPAHSQTPFPDHSPDSSPTHSPEPTRKLTPEPSPKKDTSGEKPNGTGVSPPGGVKKPSHLDLKKAHFKDQQPSPKEDATPTDDDIMANAGKRRMRSQSIFINMEESESEDDDDIAAQTNWRSKLCPTRSHRPKKHLSTQMKEKKTAKQGMMSSEVTAPGEDSKLPAIQMMIMNYNRMLEENPDEFRDALFRAVKLNGLDVLRLLCRLVLRKNINLASDQMREPESSATILHVALLLGHANMCEYLIGTKDKNLLMSTYTRQEYKNQTTLHVAVVNGNLRVIEKLLQALTKKERKNLLNTVADGTYFQDEHPEGQLCVSAAAWSKNSDSLLLLAKYGASFATADLDGNTLLHSIVLSSAEGGKIQEYQKLIDKVFEAVGVWAKHCRYKTAIADQLHLEQSQKQISTFHMLLDLQNNEGLTPLVLAAQLGSPLLLTLMNMEKIYKMPQSQLGSVAWVTYDVTDVTSFALGAYNKFSVLHILAHNCNFSHQASREGAVSPLDTEPIKTLVDKKWNIYRWIYFGWFFLHFAYISAFTSLTTKAAPPWTNMSEPYTISPGIDSDPHYHVLPFGILPLIYIILEILDWFGSYPYSFQFMHQQSFFSKLMIRAKSEWTIIGNGPYRFVLFVHSFLVLIWLGLHIKGSPLQLVMLSLALLLGWIFLLFFTRGCNATSRFSIMIQKMFFQDLMYFMTVFGLIMIAFTLSVNALYSSIHVSMLGTGILMYQMLNVVIELDDKDEIPLSTFPSFTKLVIIIYTIIALILMLNMLIAMMNTSYEAVRATKENIQKQQRLSILLMIERRLFWWRHLCRRSEGSLWHKNWDRTTRAYIDVTTTQKGLEN